MRLAHVADSLAEGLDEGADVGFLLLALGEDGAETRERLAA